MGPGDRAGGSAQLAQLIDSYGEYLIPDLQHYYGIDLRELFSEVDPLSPRWVLTHIRGLPMTSLFVAHVRGGARYIGWDEGRYMQATLIDAVRSLIWITVMANSDPKKRKPEHPEQYPVPGLTEKKKRDARPGSFAHTAKLHAQAIREQRKKA